MTLLKRESGTGDYWLVAQVVALEVEHDSVVAPSGDQIGGPRLGGGTRDPVTAGGDGSLHGSGGCRPNDRGTVVFTCWWRESPGRTLSNLKT